MKITLRHRMKAWLRRPATAAIRLFFAPAVFIQGKVERLRR
jgi:hypothetical protein